MNKMGQLARPQPDLGAKLSLRLPDRLPEENHRGLRRGHDRFGPRCFPSRSGRQASWPGDSQAELFPDARDSAQISHSIADILREHVFPIACGYPDADDLVMAVGLTPTVRSWSALSGWIPCRFPAPWRQHGELVLLRAAGHDPFENVDQPCLGIDAIEFPGECRLLNYAGNGTMIAGSISVL
jgi:hypothetical protein